jgi:hypothetical protein
MNFTKYLRTTNKNEIDDLIKLLKINNIEYELENYPSNFNSTFNVDINNIEFLLKINDKEFDKVEKIELDFYENLISNIDNDYYLFDFTETELKDILKKSDEWSKLDFILAKKILDQKGINIELSEIEEYKKQRIETLSEPEKNQAFWIVMGYIFSFMGGLLGIIIGSHLLTHKRTLPNGDKIFDYKENDRKHGGRILIIGIIVILFSILRFIYKLIG